MTTLDAAPPTGLPGVDALSRAVREDRMAWVSGIPFLAIHAAPIAAIFVSVTWQDWVLCVGLYLIRMFFITAAYHRYFAHRSYKLHRVTQFLMGVGGTLAAQKGPLWWAGHHRIHHRFTDLDDDVHSPREGFVWSHVGWILSTRYKATNFDAIKDFAAYPELRWLNRLWLIPPTLLGVGCFLWGSWGGLLIGFFLSTVLTWHGTFIVNSVAHVMGSRRFATNDTSRNSMLVALLTGGEGWHNNHHYLPSSVRQGIVWWEIDTTWYVLRALAAVGLVRDLKRPPARLLTQARIRDGAFDIGMFRSHWEHAAKLAQGPLSELDAGAPGLVPGTVGETGFDGSGAVGADFPRLITEALESAGQLAAATRHRGSASTGPVAPDSPAR